MKRLITFIVVGVVLVSCWRCSREDPADWSGTPAGDSPEQDSAGLPEPFVSGDCTITPLARYSLRAIVLRRERYRFDQSAKLAPIDLALGWGPMSAAETINRLDVYQSDRWYVYSWDGEPPIAPSLMATHSANTHCLPADDEVRDALLDLDRHELVALEGYLVSVTAPDGFTWRSSLTRNDTGGGSCEVFWVTKVVREAIKDPMEG